MDSFDLLIIGGGINGCAIARDAAGRGLSVLLVEKDDLASHTSSASSKLIHGGLRYLEQYEFGLVRESLKERAGDAAPPRRTSSGRCEFVLPDPPGGRPWWMIRLGLLLYDFLSRGDELPRSKGLGRKDNEFRAPLKPRPLQARHLLGRLGRRRPPGRPQRARRAGARRGDRHPHRIALRAPRRRGLDRRPFPAAARSRATMLVNAAGPWVAEVLNRRLGDRGRKPGPPDQGQPHPRPPPLRGRPCLYPAAGGRPRRLRLALWRPQPDRHHRRARRRARRRGLHGRRGRLSLRRRQRLFHAAGEPGRRQLVLCRRPRPLRRWRGEREGRHPRLSAGAGRHARPETALRLRRQDHHRPPPRRRGARQARRRRLPLHPHRSRSPAATSTSRSTPL